MNDAERFGRDLADFLRGFLYNQMDVSQGSTTEKEDADWSTDQSTLNSSQKKLQFPSDFELWADINNAHRLKPGNLLVVHLGTNRVFQVDVETGDIIFMFSLNWGPRTFVWRAIADGDGAIYCSLSGTAASKSGIVPPGYRAPAARFEYWGAIVKLDTRSGSLKVLAETKVPGRGPLLDPHGMQLLAEERKLLVCDFQGFGGGGAVYKIDVDSGELEMVAERGLLNETPVSALLDKDGILWVTNADMTEENDGEIIRVNLKSGSQDIFLKRSGKDAGQVVGVLQGIESEQLVIFRCEWPNVRGNSAVFLANKSTGQTEELFRSSIDDPRFYNTNGDVSGDILWFGESVRKEIIGFDLRKREVIKTIDFRGAAGGWRGMFDSYDGIESVTVIPHMK